MPLKAIFTLSKFWREKKRAKKPAKNARKKARENASTIGCTRW